MFVIKHNSGLYLFPQFPSELSKKASSLKSVFGVTLVFASVSETNDMPQLFKTAVEALDFIHTKHIGGMATPKQIVKDRNEDPDLGEMLWLINDIEGLAIKVVPFRPATNNVCESILSVEDVKFEF